MDYDATEIAATYADARKLPDTVLEGWREEIGRCVSAAPEGLVVDLGCGTGRFLPTLSGAFASDVIGMDPSQKMLREARRGNARHQLCVASAEALPIRRGAVAVVFLSNVIHHVEDRRVLARDLHRLLVPGGYVVIRNYVREDLPLLAYMSFFPEALAWSRACTPSLDEIETAFRGEGLALARKEVVKQPVADSRESYLDKIRQRAYSDLAAIGDEAFATGLARLDDAVRCGSEISLVEPLRLLSFRRS